MVKLQILRILLDFYHKNNSSEYIWSNRPEFFLKYQISQDKIRLLQYFHL